MIFCRGCGKEIHETATACPHCGATQRGTAMHPSPPLAGTDWPSVLSLVLGIFAVLGLANDAPDKDLYVGIFLLASVAIVLGGIGMAAPDRGKGMPTAGIVLGILALVGLADALL